ncbi:hypothetical protein STIUS_v1c04610 [Spiroplasma sp. TIUS-1]|uniref:hypothetical protein n=1 Tax=Spiroplasma sp. TIUS-1 TaxID=216963 RepID=UPI0013970FB1|nr:hypothetical protein [Spiroplasma sp. TIUS-1]QHX36015.1 hypothetical protein STIUS_v1c04610 [Spiroplasma sp. TIUS-1]
MSIETRMVKYKPLHNEINKEIEYWKNIESQKTKTNIISEKLRVIDKSFFEPKIKAFVKVNEIFKPYLDKDRTSLLISEEIKFDLRRYLNDLTTFESTHSRNQKLDKRFEIINNEKRVVIKDEELQRMYLSISDEVIKFNAGIKKASELNKKSLATSNLPPAIIEEMREEGKATFSASAKEISVKLEVSILSLDKKRKEWFTKSMNKKTLIIGITLVSLTFLMLILFAAF